MKICYRLLTKKDLADRVRWLNDSEVTKYLGPQVRNGTNLAKQKKWFDKMIKDKDRKNFVIEVDGKPVGNVALLEINKIDQNAGIFVVIGEKQYWGKGIAKAALKFITDYGFKRLKMHKIWLQVYAPNARAIKLYEKFGFVKEGLHTEMVKLDGKYHDEIFMSLTNPKDK